jgi:hypothetical protein
VLLEYRDAVPRLEIAVGDRLLVDGPWQWRASRGGKPLDVEGPWTLSCWESDKKATYLEIIAPLTGGLQIDRQIVLLPADRIVLLADAITQRPDSAASGMLFDGLTQSPRLDAANAGGLRVESVVPLAAALEVQQAVETREVSVSDTKPRMLALPLALPEWKTAGRGSFAVTADGLELDHRTPGTRCYSPTRVRICHPSRPRASGSRRAWSSGSSTARSTSRGTARCSAATSRVGSLWAALSDLALWTDRLRFTEPLAEVRDGHRGRSGRPLPQQPRGRS